MKLKANFFFFFIAELRPKGRGRPQRILLGNWPDDHVRQVIRAVVFRDGSVPAYTHALGGQLPPQQQLRRSASPPNSRPFSASFNSSSSASSPPHPPPPTPSSTSGHASARSPPQQNGNGTKFGENNLFASHLKQLSDHFAKNGGGGGGNGNGIFDTLQFKALMNEAMIQQPQFRRSMDFEDADETPYSRRGSLTPPLRPLDLEMPRLIPNSANSSRKNDPETGSDSGSQRSHSNENFTEDPMNLVETSWEVSSLNDENTTAANTNANNKIFQQTAAIKN